VVLRAEEAKTAAGEMDGPLWVVKAQIHAGGRGKGKFKEADAGEKGGVRLAKSVEEASDEAKKMLGRTLVTHQTGPLGKQVNRIYIEDGAGIETEMYLALLVDRQTSRVSFVCSTEGGMDIEEVAAATPEKILSFSVDPATGYQPFHGRRVAFALGLDGKQVKQCVGLMGYERAAQHLLGFLGGFFHGFGQAHAAFLTGVSFLEAALAASACVDLRLDHPQRAVERACRGLGVFGLEHDATVGDRGAVAAQKGFGLIFVDVHDLVL
jgi:hypothetical protein